MNPFSFLALQMNMTTLLFESQTVMALRMMGMSGMLPARQGENSRMVAEKGPALMRSLAAANKIAMAGGRPDEIMAASLKPLSSKVRANRRRLMR